MTEELDTSEGEAQETQESEEVVDTQEADQQEEVGFNEKQLQQMFSATGRIVKKQIEESVMPMLQTLQPQAQPGGDALDDLNQNLQTKMFEGDIVGVINEVVGMREKAATSAKGQQDVETKKAIASMSDRPYYKDTYPEIEKLTSDYVTAGYPPAAAADAAYQKAKGQHLERQLSGNTDVNLGVSGSGRRQGRTSTPKLPEAFKKAAERDIAAGHFKDEADYIANLSPDIRAKYGM